MHALQPKHIRMKPEEVKKLLDEYNISLSQLPKISVTDPALPEGCVPGEVIKIERVTEDKTQIYFRVIVP